MDFHTCIKAVGTGPKSNRELNKEEMIFAMDTILNQNIASEKIAAFLLGWRVRLETDDELKTSLEVCQKYIKQTTIENSIELGYPYDGKLDNPYLLPLVAKYVKKFDLNIVVSGDFLQPAKNGFTIKELSQNIKFDDNLHYFDRKDYFPLLSNLSEIRNILGLRTAFNTIEKLLNPAKSNFAVNAAFHKPYVMKYLNLFFDQYEKLLIVRGSEGTPEVLSRSKYWLMENDEVKEYVIDPAYFGINYNKSARPIPKEQLIQMTLNPSDDLEKLAKLNATLLLIASNRASDIKEAYGMVE